MTHFAIASSAPAIICTTGLLVEFYNFLLLMYNCAAGLLGTELMTYYQSLLELSVLMHFVIYSVHDILAATSKLQVLELIHGL